MGCFLKPSSIKFHIDYAPGSLGCLNKATTSSQCIWLRSWIITNCIKANLAYGTAHMDSGALHQRPFQGLTSSYHGVFFMIGSFPWQGCWDLCGCLINLTSCIGKIQDTLVGPRISTYNFRLAFQLRSLVATQNLNQL